MRTRTSAVTLATTLVTLVLVACSGDDATGTSASPESACAGAATKACAKFKSCASIFIQSVYGDDATCAARVQLECLAGLRANGTGATPASAVGCGSAIEGATCEALLAGEVDACWVKAGTLSDGTACAVDTQCAGSNCRKGSDASCGACSTRGGAGATCATNSDCQQPLECHGDKCVALGKAGAACSESTPCVSSLRCTGGACAKPLAAGATCDPQDSACDLIAGLFCNARTKVCATFTLAAAGAPCGLIDGAFVGCTAGGECTGATLDKPGTCRAAAADGQACDDENGPRCIEPARCVSGVCTLPDPNACK